MNQVKRTASLVLLAAMGNLVAMQKPQPVAHESEQKSHVAAWAVGGAVSVGALGYGAYRVIAAHQMSSDREFVRQQERFVQQMCALIGDEPVLNQVTSNQQHQVICALHTRFLKQSGGMYTVYHAGMYCADCLDRLEKMYEQYEDGAVLQEDEQFVAVVKKCITCELVVLHIVAMSTEFQTQASAYHRSQKSAPGQRSETSVFNLIYSVIHKGLDIMIDHAARSWGHEGKTRPV